MVDKDNQRRESTVYGQTGRRLKQLTAHDKMPRVYNDLCALFFLLERADT